MKTLHPQSPPHPIPHAAPHGAQHGGHSRRVNGQHQQNLTAPSPTEPNPANLNPKPFQSNLARPSLTYPTPARLNLAQSSPAQSNPPHPISRQPNATTPTQRNPTQNTNISTSAHLLRRMGLMPACMSRAKRLMPRPPSSASGQITVGGSCGGKGGGVSFSACLSHLTIDHASL